MRTVGAPQRGLATLESLPPTPNSRFPKIRPLRATIVAGLLIVASVVLAQDALQGGAPKAGTAPTEADYDVLRKLLGVQAPPKRAPEPEPVAEPEPIAAPEPEPAKAAAPKKAPAKAAAPKKAPPKKAAKPKAKPKPVYVPKKAPAPQRAIPAVEVEAPVEAAIPAKTFISDGVPPPWHGARGQ